jgi:Peptidase M16 inactive domain.
MVLSVAGNVDEKEVMEVCDKLLRPCDDMNLETAFEDEPDNVKQKKVTQKLEVSQPLFNIGFKQKPSQGEEMVRAEIETNIVLSLLADETSDFYKNFITKDLLILLSLLKFLTEMGISVQYLVVSQKILKKCSATF